MREARCAAESGCDEGRCVLVEDDCSRRVCVCVCVCVNRDYVHARLPVIETRLTSVKTTREKRHVQRLARSRARTVHLRDGRDTIDDGAESSALMRNPPVARCRTGMMHHVERVCTARALRSLSTGQLVAGT